MSERDRGFASMDRKTQQQIASKGGKAAHANGTAHEWTTATARIAGRKGGLASAKATAERRLADSLAAANAAGEGMTTGHDN